jgi:hypothetical protein
MPYTIFKKDDDTLDVKKLRYRRYENIWDIRYKEHDNEPSRTIYIQTPPLKLSLIEEDAHYYYLICQINSNDERFWDLMQNFDMATVEEMSEDTVNWGFREDTPLTFIEKRFVPTLKMSSINYEYSLHLIIPKTAQLDIFDQTGKPIKMENVKRDYRLAMLLLLDGVEFKNNYFNLKFCVEQMKVRIPESEMDKTKNAIKIEPTTTEDCVLNESDEAVSQHQGDVTKYSTTPKPDLYKEDDPQEEPNEDQSQESKHDKEEDVDEDAEDVDVDEDAEDEDADEDDKEGDDEDDDEEDDEDDEDRKKRESSRQRSAKTERSELHDSKRRNNSRDSRDGRDRRNNSRDSRDGRDRRNNSRDNRDRVDRKRNDRRVDDKDDRDRRDVSRNNRRDRRGDSSREESRRRDSREESIRRDSREESRRRDSREESRRRDSREESRRRDSREESRRRDSREESRRRDSREEKDLEKRGGIEKRSEVRDDEKKVGQKLGDKRVSEKKEDKKSGEKDQRDSKRK